MKRPTLRCALIGLLVMPLVTMPIAALAAAVAIPPSPPPLKFSLPLEAPTFTPSHFTRPWLNPAYAAISSR